MIFGAAKRSLGALLIFLTILVPKLALGQSASAGTNAESAISDLLWVDGVRYAQTGEGLASAARDLLARGGGTIAVPAGALIRVTAGPLAIGSVAGTMKPMVIILEPGAKISCDFDAPEADCIQLGDSVLLECLTSSLVTPAIQVGPGANVATLIAPLDRTGLQESYRLQNCSLNGKTPGANISRAVVDLTSMADNTYVARNTIYQYQSRTNAPAFLIAPGNSRGGGPIVMEQNWVDSGLNATCFAFTDGNGTNYIGPFYFRSNECQNSGTAPSIRFSTTSAGHLRNIDVDGFLSSLTSALKIIDVNGCYHCIFRNIQVSTNATSGVTGIYFASTPGMNAGNIVQNIFVAGAGFRQAIYDEGNRYSSGITNVNSTSSSYYQVNPNGMNNQDFTAMRFVEGASPFGFHGPFAQSAVDACYADSKAHSIECSYNNANAHPLRPIELGSCTMANGSCTFLWATPFASSPACVASWNGSGRLTGAVKTSSSPSACVVTSTTNTDTAAMQIVGVGNPN
jgi:hypothetical protein